MSQIPAQRITLMTNAITAATQGISAPVAVKARDQVVVYFKSTSTTSSGTFKIEEADYDPSVEPVYAGTWSQVGADVLASAFTGGAAQAIHLPQAAYGNLRVRQTVDVGGGGSVTVVMVIQ